MKTEEERLEDPEPSLMISREESLAMEINIKSLKSLAPPLPANFIIFWCHNIFWTSGPDVPVRSSADSIPFINSINFVNALNFLCCANSLFYTTRMAGDVFDRTHAHYSRIRWKLTVSPRDTAGTCLLIVVKWLCDPFCGGPARYSNASTSVGGGHRNDWQWLARRFHNCFHSIFLTKFNDGPDKRKLW